MGKILDQARKIAKKKAKFALPKQIKEAVDEAFPETSKERLRVYNYIRFGHIIRDRNMIGATDDELQRAMPDLKESTIRWSRWSMQKQGFIQKTLTTRETKVGGRKMPVYEITMLYPSIKIVGMSVEDAIEYLTAFDERFSIRVIEKNGTKMRADDGTLITVKECLDKYRFNVKTLEDKIVHAFCWG